MNLHMNATSTATPPIIYVRFKFTRDPSFGTQVEALPENHNAEVHDVANDGSRNDVESIAAMGPGLELDPAVSTKELTASKEYNEELEGRVGCSPS